MCFPCCLFHYKLGLVHGPSQRMWAWHDLAAASNVANKALPVIEIFMRMRTCYVLSAKCVACSGSPWTVEEVKGINWVRGSFGNFWINQIWFVSKLKKCTCFEKQFTKISEQLLFASCFRYYSGYWTRFISNLERFFAHELCHAETRFVYANRRCWRNVVT